MGLRELLKPKNKWPDTDPIDKTDPYWEFNNNCNINGTPYKKEEVSPGKWQWVVNEEIIKLKNEQEKSRQDLLWALQSRVLTDEEMARVQSYDYHLLVREMVPFFETDVRKQFGEMLLLQFKLRTAANKT